MRTTLNLDSEALLEAMRYNKDKTRTEVINEALREYGRHRRMRELIDLRGKVPWDGDLDALRKRA